MINEVIKSFIDDFSNEPIIPKNTEVFNNSLVLISENLKNLKLKGTIFSKGLIIFKKKSFSYLINLNKKRLKNYLILNEKSSFLFTCNRIIFLKGVVKKNGKGPCYAVFNDNDELLGVAYHEKSGLKNKVNIGYYLNQDNLKEPLF
jgi:ribosome biogenesis protein Nip4